MSAMTDAGHQCANGCNVQALIQFITSITCPFFLSPNLHKSLHEHIIELNWNFSLKYCLNHVLLLGISLDCLNVRKLTALSFEI